MRGSSRVWALARTWLFGDSFTRLELIASKWAGPFAPDFSRGTTICRSRVGDLLFCVLRAGKRCGAHPWLPHARTWAASGFRTWKKCSPMQKDVHEFRKMSTKIQKLKHFWFWWKKTLNFLLRFFNLDEHFLYFVNKIYIQWIIFELDERILNSWTFLNSMNI